MGLKLEIGKEFQSNKDHKGGIGVLMNTPTIIELQENSQRILPCSNPKFPVKCLKYKNKFWIWFFFLLLSNAVFLISFSKGGPPN